MSVVMWNSVSNGINERNLVLVCNLNSLTRFKILYNKRFVKKLDIQTFAALV